MASLTTVEISERGNPRNQDRLAVLAPAGADALVALVADGAGGQAGGAEAAERCVRAIEDSIARSGSPPARDALLTALRQLDSALVADPAAGLTTAVIICVAGDHVWGASVGDSAAWMVDADKPGSWDDLTRHQQRKPLLGSGAARAVGFGPLPVRGRMLLATDGLLNFAKHSQLALALHDCDCDQLESLAQQLVDLARMRNGELQDDTSLIVIDPHPGSATAEAAAQTSGPEQDEGQPERPPSLTILFVENHPTFANAVVSQFLSDHRVVIVASQREASVAVDALAPGAFDLALVDYDLDDGKGDQVVRYLRSASPSTALIGVSAREDGNAALLAAGADAVCPKLRFATIRDVIRRVLGE
jgi:serine/threonine protein phosphatase PrpC/CheY-like chemotaxis protein